MKNDMTRQYKIFPMEHVSKLHQNCVSDLCIYSVCCDKIKFQPLKLKHVNWISVKCKTQHEITMSIAKADVWLLNDVFILVHKY